jgi:hypothetical protein
MGLLWGFITSNQSGKASTGSGAVLGLMAGSSSHVQAALRPKATGRFLWFTVMNSRLPAHLVVFLY